VSPSPGAACGRAVSRFTNVGAPEPPLLLAYGLSATLPCSMRGASQCTPSRSSAARRPAWLILFRPTRCARVTLRLRSLCIAIWRSPQRIASFGCCMQLQHPRLCLYRSIFAADGTKDVLVCMNLASLRLTSVSAKMHGPLGEVRDNPDDRTWPEGQARMLEASLGHTLVWSIATCTFVRATRIHPSPSPPQLR
jgi:hypothetical protein